MTAFPKKKAIGGGRLKFNKNRQKISKIIQLFPVFLIKNMKYYAKSIDFYRHFVYNVL